MAGYPYAPPPPAVPPPPPPPAGGDDAEPKWPAWYGPAAFFGGLCALFVLLGFVSATGLDIEAPGVTMAATVVQYGIFAAFAIFLAAQTRRPRPWDFGFRRAPFKRTLGIAAGALVLFYLIAIVYNAVAPEGEQSVAEDLGTENSTLALVAGAFLVIGIAPFAEEFFFRGFFYRALRTRFPIAIAAIVDGVLFGLVHFTGEDTLPVLPVLAVLGVIFCVVYERTGTLYATIGMHAFNNMLAYAAVTGRSVGVSLFVGACTIGACGVLARNSPRRAPAPAG